ncbi:MAG: stage III sporulation protein AC [Clostridia bacterium]|nr:stage III sporulation protein AC [Clostridia bacterium]
MDISLILKVGGVGFLVSVIYQILSKSGREEQALFVSISGMILVLLMLIGQLGELIASVRQVFGI